MIKFFRTIRKNLIEENKTSKYFKYAVGEIVLVVIGILIALQINNWNQASSEYNRFNGNLVYILEDIEQNQIELNELKNNRKETLQACITIVDKFRQSQWITNEVWNNAFYNAVVEKRFQGNFNSFEKAKSSDVYEKEKFLKARNIVLEYDKLIEELYYVESKLNLTIEEIERELLQNDFYDKIWDHLRVEFIDSMKYEKPKEHLNYFELMKAYPEVKGIFLRFEADAPSILKRYKAIFEKGEELKSEIQTYLDKNSV